MLKTLDYWKEKGFIDEPVEGIDLKKEIRRMCEEKNAIILAHYYTVGDIQDVADFVGDSLPNGHQLRGGGPQRPAD
ncbi:MAG: quinolinate synthase NadA, partial [Prevotella sp.]|nr:quinolinate synthase NadA [Prevotella sp.]